MFQGAVALSLDAKGRLSIPARHRDALAASCDGQLLITVHPHRCLLIYPKPEWEPIQAQLLALSGFDARSASLKRMLVGFAEDQGMDAQGRVMVSPSLRDFAELGKEVHLVGQGNHFELWSDARWQDEKKKMFEVDLSSLPENIGSMSL
ncbi:division/cell wall cluster transcriptional repressor MraZ [Niveibacterium terrae]|uniref:division/cell wall cluster transcriptional repressor MraZ n=1 Tax=Niveibacterium terrae TaxID=3373598 RepID=UPI003A93E9B7